MTEALKTKLINNRNWLGHDCDYYKRAVRYYYKNAIVYKNMTLNDHTSTNRDTFPEIAKYNAIQAHNHSFFYVLIKHCI